MTSYLVALIYNQGKAVTFCNYTVLSEKINFLIFLSKGYVNLLRET